MVYAIHGQLLYFINSTISLPACQLCCEQVLFLAASVCLRVCASVLRKSRKLLVENRCNLAGICPMGNARNGWKLVTFDLDSHFHIFLIQAIPVEWLYLATSFFVWRYIFKISRSWVQGQGHISEKVIVCNSKTTGPKLLGLGRNICYNNARSNLELLTF